MPKAIEARLNVTLDPVTVAAVTPAVGYGAAAEAIVPALAVLADSQGQAIPVALLAGHALECLLKATLSHQGVPERELKAVKVRHNLEALWLRAAGGQSPFNTTIPGWAQTLSRLHNNPYYLRYPIGVNGLVLPNPEECAQELAELLREVRERLRK